MVDEDPQELRDPIVLAAFAGWNDAGEAATSVIEHLAEIWQAEVVAGFDPEDYYDMQVHRPSVVRRGGRRVIEWPTTSLLVARPAGLDRDVLLVRGIEPSMRWGSFTQELIDWVVEAGAREIVTLGALMADVPHTRPLPVQVSATARATQRRLDATPSDYEGPTGIVGVVDQMADAAGLESVSVWVSIPHYAAGSPSPRATWSLLTSLEEVLDCVIDLGDLEELADAWTRGVDELMSDDDSVADYVRALEEAVDELASPQASGDALAKEFEQYLRRRQSDGGNTPPV
ncbi:Predicted ATP-dependent carboligase, ATP-grasp superfamily [Kytococcus aerolatus]|uniref:Predicted ATP-dependent carboligase, ATP-grasp superfamily n=1 Tax=Kytococcus aerolatus TaxID=592308 RepID=A0A212T1I3_9MICO|nr:PAC2 family protein [Kytococcus aerolatus]SNC59913.1 Predicted ATP-dependent carboligase, ATP-grasp superfamily [Kytococcus aerolatus]